jgi:hypothetical protein
MATGCPLRCTQLIEDEYEEWFSANPNLQEHLMVQSGLI